jgi:hypothetical protein
MNRSVEWRARRDVKPLYGGVQLIFTDMVDIVVLSPQFRYFPRLYVFSNAWT